MADLRPLDIMAASTCERLAVDIRAGRLTTLQFSVADKDVFVLSIEAVNPQALAGDQAEEANEEPTQPGRKKTGCPGCGRFEIRDAGDGYKMCLDCNLNWSPSGQAKKE